MWLFADPAFILKRELQWIPFFGWFAWKARMIPVDRGAGSQALAEMTERARSGARRRPADHDLSGRHPPRAGRRAELQIRHRASLCRDRHPCLPIALNSGLFWPRRSFLRYPGTIVVEILDPIPPGLGQDAFMARLQDDDRDCDRAADCRRASASLPRNGIAPQSVVGSSG